MRGPAQSVPLIPASAKWFWSWWVRGGERVLYGQPRSVAGTGHYWSGANDAKSNRLWSLSFRKAGLNWQLMDTHRCCPWPLQVLQVPLQVASSLTTVNQEKEVIKTSWSWWLSCRATVSLWSSGSRNVVPKLAASLGTLLRMQIPLWSSG